MENNILEGAILPDIRHEFQWQNDIEIKYNSKRPFKITILPIDVILIFFIKSSSDECSQILSFLIGFTSTYDQGNDPQYKQV